MSEECRNCHFWLPYAPGTVNQENKGVCRAHPPKLSSDVRTSASPITPQEHWCGEWSKLRSELES